MQPSLRAEVSLVRSRHADHITPILHDLDLRFRLEARPAHLHIRFPRVNLKLRRQIRDQHGNEIICDQRRAAFEFVVKKRRRPLLQAHVVAARHQRPRRQIFLERAHRVQRDDILKPKVRQRADVRPIVNRVRRQRQRVAVAVDQHLLAP